MLTKMKIQESIAYEISQLICWGQGRSSGRRQNIAESFAKSLGKILGKFCEFKISPKPQHYTRSREISLTLYLDLFVFPENPYLSVYLKWLPEPASHNQKINFNFGQICLWITEEIF